MSAARPPRPRRADPARDDLSLVEELARLRPRPADRDLPHAHHQQRKELLMQQIDHDLDAGEPASAAGATDAAPARGRWFRGPARPVSASAAGRSPAGARPRVRRAAVLVPAGALALAGALTLALLPHGGGGAPGDRGTAAGSRQAVVLLHRVSRAALGGASTPVRDDQYVYVKSVRQDADQTSGKAVTGPKSTREVWLSQDPKPVKRIGLFRENGDTLPINAELGDADGTAVGLYRPTYRWLASLPTDPRALLARLREETAPAAGHTGDQTVFDWIGGLLSEAVLPPANAAALYEAAALIPGVVPDPGATDASGRHGVGIRRDDSGSGERSEWVFDAEDLSFLGSRTYLTRDTATGAKGTLLSAQAVLERGVVDRAGVAPTPQQLRRTTHGAVRG